MLESGARYEHVLRMIETWCPDEFIEIPCNLMPVNVFRSYLA